MWYNGENRTGGVPSPGWPPVFFHEVKGLSEGKRELGVDLLRMVSMYLVVVLHLLGRGGVLDGAAWLSWRYSLAWLLETASMCAVNCFALISGYVGVKSVWRPSRALGLWLQTVFYALGLNLIYAAARPGAVSGLTLLKSLFPMTTGMYWYITAYFGLTFFTPLLNIALRRTPRKLLGLLILSALCLTGFLPCVLQQSPYGLKDGYSMAWLGILYLLGGHIRLTGLPRRMGKGRAVCLFALSTLAAWGSKLALEYITVKRFGEARWSGTFLSYLSPFMVLNALALLCLFAQTDLKGSRAARLVGTLSPAALGVYLIHVHPAFWGEILGGMAAPLLNCPAPIMAAGVLALALVLYAGCTIAELLRLQLFRVLTIPTLIRRLDSWLADKLSE